MMFSDEVLMEIKKAHKYAIKRAAVEREFDLFRSLVSNWKIFLALNPRAVFLPTPE
jgi:hypothetical protein